jgi:competence protein ComEA
MEYLRNAFESISNWWFDLHYTPNQKRGLLVISALLLIISYFIVVRGNTQAPVAEISSPIVVQEVAIFVDVAGAVNNPGVYSLTGKSRVIDAIKAAGDSAPGADLSTINLARIVSDGEQIYVDWSSANRSSGGVKKNVRIGPVNLNRATKSQLDSLDGIGPVIAQRIIDYRKVNGPFLTIEDIQKVSGIGTAKFAQIKSKIQV